MRVFFTIYTVLSVIQAIPNTKDERDLGDPLSCFEIVFRLLPGAEKRLDDAPFLEKRPDLALFLLTDGHVAICKVAQNQGSPPTKLLWVLVNHVCRNRYGPSAYP